MAHLGSYLMAQKTDNKKRDQTLANMLATPPTPNKPLKEMGLDKDQNDRDPASR